MLSDLGGDSLDVVEPIMELEEDLELTMPDMDAENIHSVGDFGRYLARREPDAPDRAGS